MTIKETKLGSSVIIEITDTAIKKGEALQQGIKGMSSYSKIMFSMENEATANVKFLLPSGKVGMRKTMSKEEPIETMNFDAMNITIQNTKGQDIKLNGFIIVY